jgi:GNAT superfamily N-acetyltransferase
MEEEFTLSIDDINVGRCLLVQENENIYEINDVFIKEEYRGNGYAKKLLEKVIENLKMNKTVAKSTNKKITLKISSEITNIPAFKTYQKVFGNPYRYDSRYGYFCIYL